MPGSYAHWPTVQSDRDGEFVYNSTGSNWVVVDAAQDFLLDMNDVYFMIDETKEIPFTVTNNGAVAAKGITFTVQIHNRFTYQTGSMVAGDGTISPTTERYEGGGLFIQFPETLEIPAGETVNFRFQAKAN